MLQELRISNIAIVEDLTIPLNQGLTVVTGETGAGKSVISGSLELLCGSVVSDNIIRHEEQEGYVEAVFVIEIDSEEYKKIKKLGIRIDADGVLVLRREIRKEGRNSVLINGLVSSLTLLKSVSELLISVQSQDLKRTLGNKTFAVDFMDNMLGLMNLRIENSKLWRSWLDSKAELANRYIQRDHLASQYEFMKFQLEELDNANLDINEEEELAESLEVYRNHALLTESCSNCNSILNNSEPSVRTLLASAVSSLSAVAGKSAKLDHAIELLESAEVAVSEATAILTNFYDSLSDNSSSHESLEERELLYSNLKRKYKKTTAELVLFCEELREQVEQFDSAENNIDKQKQICNEIRNKLLKTSSELHQQRVDGSKELSLEAEKIIKKLGLPEFAMKFEIDSLAAQDDDFHFNGKSVGISELGIDDVSISICTNKGEQFGDLSEIASGGEQSRLFLAFHSMLVDIDKQSTMMLDEADAGLGLDSAKSVASLLKRISRNRQVICVTHLPTMAVAGEYHLKVEKLKLDCRTIVKVEQISDEHRVDEISRLLGGLDTNTSQKVTQQEYAKELLKGYA